MHSENGRVSYYPAGSWEVVNLHGELLASGSTADAAIDKAFDYLVGSGLWRVLSD